MTATSGGLNQQRTGIIDAVVTAHILNATLVVPKLDHKSYWKDKRNFSEIFNVSRFNSYLEKDVEIITQLPTGEGKVLIPHSTRVPRKCNSTCYENLILPVLEKKSMFEPDMLAFSGCNYGGGEKVRNSDKERQGKCPLIPEEVGLMLRALGFGNDAHIYVASGEVYGGQDTLGPLKALFPNLHSKESLASEEELAPFSSFSSRMAALDFIVCDNSDIFVTNNNGNMAKILAGGRRYFGHKPTIRPNAKKLYKLFMNRNSMTWEEFASRVQTFQIGFMGEPNEVRPGRGEFHENPSSCICEYPEANIRQNDGKGSKLKKERGEVIDEQVNDQEIYDDFDQRGW